MYNINVVVILILINIPLFLTIHCVILILNRESNSIHLRVTRPPEICIHLVFEHIHATGSYTTRRQFIPFICFIK